MVAFSTLRLSFDGSPAARYEQVKSFILQKVRMGEWKAGEKIPSENDLARTLGISRMTINRALRELSEEGQLVRRGGVGTFVSEPRPHSTLLRIAHIGDEVRSRGHQYSWKVLLNRKEKAAREIADAMSISEGSIIFHLKCVHYENGIPVQLEDRYVNPVCAPQFLAQKFESMTPSEYLLGVVPADEIEHMVDAVLPTHEAALLDLPVSEPCLLLSRRTWADGAAVTFVRFTHPASRYRLGCRFKPSSLQDRS
jgi:GntR family histidine utilization transcriptional repressor